MENRFNVKRGNSTKATGHAKHYNPKPVDTTGIELPQELLLLTEKIAKNVHDVWAVGRIAEGWVYGETKDSEKKTTPLLVPYEELTDSEKEYDRNTAFETLKLITKLGYSITKTQQNSAGNLRQNDNPFREHKAMSAQPKGFKTNREVYVNEIKSYYQIFGGLFKKISTISEEEKLYTIAVKGFYSKRDTPIEEEDIQVIEVKSIDRLLVKFDNNSKDMPILLAMIDFRSLGSDNVTATVDGCELLFTHDAAIDVLGHVKNSLIGASREYMNRELAKDSLAIRYMLTHAVQFDYPFVEQLGEKVKLFILEEEKEFEGTIEKVDILFDLRPNRAPYTQSAPYCSIEVTLKTNLRPIKFKYPRATIEGAGLSLVECSNISKRTAESNAILRKLGLF